jgi:hypothetical protein
MTARLQNFLLSLVRAVLERNDGTDRINAAMLELPETALLHSLGYIGPDGDLSKDAFVQYFDLIPTLVPPPDVQAWCLNFGLLDIQWKRASGPLKDTSRAFVCLNVILILIGSKESAWFHELAHLVFSKIPKALVLKLVEAAKVYPTVFSDGVTEKVTDPDTGKVAVLPKGSYLNLNGFYCGLDHSGKENETDELWAALFAQYCCKLPLDDNLCSVLFEITEAISMTSEVSERV